jgi:hypothetical protein
MEKKEHAARLATLQRQRITELAAAVDFEVNTMTSPPQQEQRPSRPEKKGKVSESSLFKVIVFYQILTRLCSDVLLCHAPLKGPQC